MEKSINSDKVNPRDLKRRLAREIITLYHGKTNALDAEKEFDKIFINKQIPSELPEFNINKNEKIWIVKLLTSANMSKSSSEARRLIKQGGVTIDGNKINDTEMDIEFSNEAVLKVGKKRFLKIIPE